MLEDFRRIFEEWSDKIEQCLEEADNEKKDDRDSHPR